MKLILFEMAVVARTIDGDLLMALMDGTGERGAPHECVALLSCPGPVAEALCAGVSSAMKDLEP